MSFSNCSILPFYCPSPLLNTFVLHQTNLVSQYVAMTHRLHTHTPSSSHITPTWVFVSFFSSSFFCFCTLFAHKLSLSHHCRSITLIWTRRCCIGDQSSTKNVHMLVSCKKYNRKRFGLEHMIVIWHQFERGMSETCLRESCWPRNLPYRSAADLMTLNSRPNRLFFNPRTALVLFSLICGSNGAPSSFDFPLILCSLCF